MAVRSIKIAAYPGADELRVYRSLTPIDTSALPAILATIDANSSLFIDDETPSGVNVYYVISAYSAALAMEAFSAPLCIPATSGEVVDLPPVVVEPLDEFLTVQNNGFETGDLTGWTVESGAVVIATGSEYSDNANSPRTGSYMIYNGISSGGLLVQEIDVSDKIANIDGDTVEVTLKAFLITDIVDTGQLVLRFLDGSGAAIGLDIEGALTSRNSSTWLELSLQSAVPVLTRKIVIGLRGVRGNSGSVCQVYFDDVSLYIEG